MSLTFAGSTTDKVTVTNPLTFGAGTEFTYDLWVKQDSAPANAAGTNKGSNDLLVFFNNWFSNVIRATTDANTVPSGGTVFPDANWTYLAITYSEADGIRFFRGTLTTAPVELGYASPRTVGSGNTAADSGDLYICNRGSTGSNSPAHTIHSAQLSNTRLTLGQITARWRRSRNYANTVFRLSLGNNGTGTQPDLSGNGHSGTVTGATQTANAPLPKSRRKIAYPYAIVAAGGSNLIPLLRQNMRGGYIQGGGYING